MRSITFALLGAFVWLCPVWWDPTPAVMPLVWGGVCLAIWIIIEALNGQSSTSPVKLDLLFYILLVSLAAAIALRSHHLPNTLVAVLCLICIGLAAQLSARLHLEHLAIPVAASWLLAGLANGILGLIQYFGLTAEPLGTAFGLLRQRNQLATLCNIALISLLYFSLHYSAKPIRVKFSRPSLIVMSMTLSLPLIAALAATCSRTGFLEFVVLIMATLLYARIKRNTTLALVALWGLGGYVLFAWLMPYLSGYNETIFGRLSGPVLNEDLSDLPIQDSRRLLWANTIWLIQAEPLLGVGWRMLASSLYKTDFDGMPRFGVQADNAHNLPLHLAVELGLPFTLLWFGVLFWLMLRYPPWRATMLSQILAWGVLAVIGIHSLLEYPLWYAPFQIAVGLSAGVLFCKPASISYVQDTSPARSTPFGLAGVGLLCFCGYATFDYYRVKQLFLPNLERAPLYQEETLAKTNQTWLFTSQVNFAEFVTTPVTVDNAKRMQLLGEQVLRFSPEPIVIQKLNEALALQ